MKSTARRHFLRASGGAVSAVILPAAIAAAPASHNGEADDLAMRALYRDYAAALPTPILYDPAQLARDEIEIATDGVTARGRFHCLAYITEPLTGSGTIVEMARLQGNVASARWERSVHELTFTKTSAGWAIDQCDGRSGTRSLPA